MQGKIFREKEIKIKVKEELEIVQFYLYLQKSRYQDKLSYEVKLEDEKIGEDLIPRLLIEPLVENAVSHGLEPKRGKGNLQVLLYEREMLYIWVKDDGVGVCRNQTKAEENKEKLLIPMWAGKIQRKCSGSCMEIITSFRSGANRERERK